MVVRAAFALGLLALGCAEAPPPRVVVVPEPEREPVVAAEPPARDLVFSEPENDPEQRCLELASSVNARAAWVNPNMLRLELGAPAQAASYSSSEPLKLVGATLRSKQMTRDSAVVLLDLSAFRIGVLANVPLECDGEVRRVRVMIMPNNGKLLYGNEFHIVERDVAP